MKMHLARRSLRYVAVALVAATGVASSAHGAVLAAYDMSGAAPSNPVGARTYSVPASTTGTNTTPSPITPNNPGYNGSNDGSAVTLNYTTMSTSNNAGGPSLAVFTGNNPNSPTAAISVTNNYYVTLTVTANSGFALNLTSLAFKAASNNVGTDRGYALQTSATGFSTDSSTNIDTSGTVSAGTFTALSNAVDSTPEFGPPPSFGDFTYTLSGAAYQGLSSITFRFFTYAPTSGGGVSFDDITLNGTVAAVPEPSFAALGLGAVSTMLAARRRRD